jgi:hypothetical protein
VGHNDYGNQEVKGKEVRIMKKLALIFFALVVFTPNSISAQTANKSWPAFWAEFKSAVTRKDKAAILALAIDDSRFERTAGGDSAAELAEGLATGWLSKSARSDLNSGFKVWRGGKITRKGCLFFKFVRNRWYWAGVPCD